MNRTIGTVDTSNGQAVTQALIFAAGLGTRFKPWTDAHPKALAPVNGKPLLQRNIEYLQRYGICKVVVNVHHFADQIEKAIGDNNGWGSQVSISDERTEVLETGGGLLKAEALLNGQPFLTINSDILTNLHLARLIAFHQQRQPLITLAVTDRNTSRFFLFDENNGLCGWRNTATGEEKLAVKKGNLIPKAYSGIAVFNPAVFKLIPFTGKFSLVDVYLALAAEHPVIGYNHTGDHLIDVGKPENVAKAEMIFQ